MDYYRIGFIIDNEEFTRLSGDKPSTTSLLIQECCLREYKVFGIPVTSLYLANNIPGGWGYRISYNSKKYDFQQSDINLNDLDLILIRHNPPIDMNYIFSTYILDFVDKSRSLIINNPSGIRKSCEKLYLYNFPELAPAGITTSNIKIIKNFIDEYQEVIVKPLDNFAGNGIFLLKKGDKNINSILESATNNGKNIILAQKYLNPVEKGDKRLILLGGKPVASITRLPNDEDFRANMCKGGFLMKSEITEEERRICNQISDSLIKEGLYFVGLDIIANKLIEINVTSPGFFIRKINSMFNIKLESKVVDYMEELLSIKREFSLA